MFDRITQEFALEHKQTGTAEQQKLSDLEFIISPAGLNFHAWPSQIFLLKLLLSLPLDNRAKCIRVPDMFNEEVKFMLTEQEFLSYLYNEGRCNIPTVDPNRRFREFVLCVGRRGSKSTITSKYIALRVHYLLSHHNPQEYFKLDLNQEITLSILAVGMRGASRLFRAVSATINGASYFRPYTVASTGSEMVFRTNFDKEQFGENSDKGSIRVMVQPSKASSVRGAANFLVGFDEQAHMRESFSDISDKALFDALEPSIGDFKGDNGQLESTIFDISTPLNRSGVFYDRYTYGMNNKDGHVLVVQMPTWELNPGISSENLRSAFARDEDIFWREWGAKFSDKISAWLPNPDVLQKCVMKEVPTVNHVRMPHYMGIDLGLFDDGTAISIVHWDKDIIVHDYSDSIYPGLGMFENVDVLDLERDVVDWIVKIYNQFYIVDGIADQWNSAPLIQALNRKGIRAVRAVTFDASLNSQIYQNAKTLIYTEKVKILNHPVLLPELLRLQAIVKSKYQVKVEAPPVPGLKDDISDSFVRAVWSAFEAKDKNIERAIARTNKSYSGGRYNRADLSVRRALAAQERRHRLYGSQQINRPFGR